MIRGLARLGVLSWFVNHQRLVTTFVTNVRGPAQPLRFLGVSVREVLAVSQTTGNVTVAFAALSYAGVLNVTIVADPERCPDLPLLAEALQRDLDVLAGTDLGTRHQPVQVAAGAGGGAVQRDTSI